MERELITRLIYSYGCAMGQQNKTIPPKFVHYVRPDFVHSSISPCLLLPDENLEASDLATLAATQLDFFEGDKTGMMPFFGFFCSDGYDVRQISELARNEGWVEEFRVAIEYFDDFISTGATSAEFIFDTGALQKDAKLLERVMKLSEIIFGMPQAVCETIKKINLESPKPAFGVVARSLKTGEDVAAGIVYVRDDTAFLTGAAILPDFRGKGIWRHMVRRRQELCRAIGARHWFYDTANQAIASKGKQSVEMINYILPPSGARIRVSEW